MESERSISLLVMTDGRKDCISQTIPSALSMLDGPIVGRYIYDDSGDDAYRRWLFKTFPTFELLFEPERQGFGGAIRAAWNTVKNSGSDYIFHLEDDFLFNEPIPLQNMMDVLDANSHLYQMALRRQAWSTEEKAVGGVIEQHPDAYHQTDSDLGSWLEHRLYFTTNPGLYRSSLIDIGWPDGLHSEGMFTHKILGLDPEARFGLWGQRTDAPRVHHIGTLRVGTSY